jgi:hypothetical protein
MELDAEDIARFGNAIGRFEKVLDSVGSGGNRVGNATITVNAGGVGVWVAVTCCAVMLTIGIIGGFLYIDQSRKVDQMQDYLNAIYMQAPYLKPKDK